MTLPRVIKGTAPVLIIVDHGSNAVPPGIDLGIDPALLDTHIAIDIGAAAVAEALAARLDARAIIATVSRLVIDCNREPDAPGIIPAASDGHVIPGNVALSDTERQLRIDAIYTPYHAEIVDEIARSRPRLIVSLHSFTPSLAARPDERRPWPLGILYNHDDRAARIALKLLADTGIAVGDNQPYSGRDLNYTMNRHAEANGIPYLGLEVRQDEIGDPTGIARWAGIIVPVVARVLAEQPDPD